MHQFQIEPMFGTDHWQLLGHNIAFTNSALWMAIAVFSLWVFVFGGMKHQLVPGRWQMAVESMTGFVDNLLAANVGPNGRKYVPYIFSLFMFILFSNVLGLLPLGLFGARAQPFTVTSHFSVTGVLAILSFSIVLIVGFYKHGFHFFSLFVPHGTPIWLLWLIPVVELISFLVRPFSLALRLFVAMIAGHILVDVFGYFIVNGINAGTPMGYFVSAISFVFIAGVNALELLVCAIQAYVFALLTSLYINDAVHLH
jgi:F-type H+-transporting ATPase subunit a